MGVDPGDARYGFIMLHGRGSDINDMRSVLPTLQLKDAYVLLPQAPLEIMPGRYAWYPHFWNENLEENLEHLENAFRLINSCVNDMVNKGIKQEKIVLLGHSQGANLIMEYYGFKPRPFQAVVSLRGCFLGNFGEERHFSGKKFPNTIIMLNAGRRDPYIPIRKIDQTYNTLKRMGARVFKRQYETGHGICRSELIDLRKLIARDFARPEE